MGIQKKKKKKVNRRELDGNAEEEKASPAWLPARHTARAAPKISLVSEPF